MKIGFDLDGVIIDHSDLKIMLAESRGFNLSHKQTPSEIMKNLIPGDEYLAIQLSLYNDPENPSPLMGGVLDVLEFLKDRKIKFFLISRRKNIPVVGEWFKKRGLSKYFTSDNTFFVETKEAKDEIAKKLGVTHYFDDELGVLEKLKSVENKFLFDNHNVFPESKFYTKVSSWDEIKKQLRI